MKIFISWSGNPSQAVALALRDWLPFVFHDVVPFVSSEDIRKGKKWPIEVSGQLADTHFGIVCLTPDNLEAPWVIFEAGALSKSIKESGVYTLLLGGLKAGDVDGPLSHFQHTLFEKQDFFRLIKSINEAYGNAKLPEIRLITIFEKFWPDLEKIVLKAVKKDNVKPKQRTTDDMLREVLEITTTIARNLPPKQGEKDTPIIKAPARRPPPPRPAPQKTPWDDLVDLIGKASPFTRTFLQEASGAFDAATKTLHITYDNEHEDHIILVDNLRNHTLIQTKLAEMGFAGWKVDFAIDDGEFA